MRGRNGSHQRPIYRLALCAAPAAMMLLPQLAQAQAASLDLSVRVPAPAVLERSSVFLSGETDILDVCRLSGEGEVSLTLEGSGRDRAFALTDARGNRLDYALDIGGSEKRLSLRRPGTLSLGACDGERRLRVRPVSPEAAAGGIFTGSLTLTVSAN